jgi:tRNA (guanine6-N2)-methyltransferase
VQTAVLEGMTARYPRWTPLAEGAQVELHVELLGSQLLCGFLVVDKRTEPRQKLALVGADETRPSLAAALVLLTEPEATDLFLDPLCDNGRILFARRSFGPYGRLIGVDLAEEALAVAQGNLVTRRRGSLPDDIELHLWDYDSLPLADESVDKVATVLPDSKQVGDEREMKTLYAGIFRELARVLRPGGRAVVLSREYDAVKGNLRERPLLEIQTGYSVKVGAQWGRIYVILRGRGIEN